MNLPDTVYKLPYRWAISLPTSLIGESNKLVTFLNGSIFLANLLTPSNCSIVEVGIAFVIPPTHLNIVSDCFCNLVAGEFSKMLLNFSVGVFNSFSTADIPSISGVFNFVILGAFYPLVLYITIQFSIFVHPVI